jgi:hypothetical protein
MSQDNVTVRALLERPGRATRTAEAAAPDDETDYTAFSFGRVGNRPQMTLVFRMNSGEVIGFPYAHITGIRADDCERSFTIDFGTATVTVVGNGLGRLFRYVCEHRVLEIVELDRRTVLSRDAVECLVDSIRVTRRSTRATVGS